MNYQEKYLYKPYNKVFPLLFKKEKERLQKSLGKNIQIEHIGSTAIPSMPGKGVIYICISVPRKNWDKIRKNLEKIGYEFKPQTKEREKFRLFFMASLPDKLLRTQIYHIHLTYPGSVFLKGSLAFLNYLKRHPKDFKRYAAVKKEAAQKAQVFKTKKKMKETYMNIKGPFIEEILSKLGFKKLPD